MPNERLRDALLRHGLDLDQVARATRVDPKTLERWEGLGLYHAIRAERQAKGAPLFVLHDGPPYANGAIHIGHALQKTLKDFVVRSRFLLGYDVDYVPGWDCHGLPIEWKIEEELRGQGRRKDEVTKAEFRTRCRDYAETWIGVQMAGFKRLGVIGDWEHRYATMDYPSEAAIVAEFHKFLMSGQLYRGSKPVMWSPVERTALADAEVEYHDHVSPTIWVKFPVIEGSDATRGASVVIWTTTPWTIPANRAISFSSKIEYGLYRVTKAPEGNFVSYTYDNSYSSTVVRLQNVLTVTQTAKSGSGLSAITQTLTYDTNCPDKVKTSQDGRGNTTTAFYTGMESKRATRHFDAVIQNRQTEAIAAIAARGNVAKSKRLAS